MPRALMMVLLLVLGGCVAYEPVPVPAYPAGPSNFDRAWSASMGAVQDAGIRINSADAASGLIRGTKDGIEVTVSVTRQADRSVRVHFERRGGDDRDPGLAGRFSQFYDRRMGM